MRHAAAAGHHWARSPATLGASSARPRDANVGMEGLARHPVQRHKAPPLFIEGPVRVWTAPRCRATFVMIRWRAFTVLPPLIGKLKHETAQADAVWPHSAPPHDLLGQLL